MFCVSSFPVTPFLPYGLNFAHHVFNVRGCAVVHKFYYLFFPTHEENLRCVLQATDTKY